MRKGYTLIELVVYFSLICIISSIAIFSISYIRDLNNNISKDAVKTEIVEFIEDCRRRCKLNECFGEILIDETRNRFVYKEGRKVLDKLLLEDQCSIEYFTIIRSEDIGEGGNLISPTEKFIRIDSSGKMDAGSIFFSDKNNKGFSLVITVDTNRVRIKDDEA